MNNKKTKSLQKLIASREAIINLIKLDNIKVGSQEFIYFTELLDRTESAIKQLELLIEIDERINKIEGEKTNGNNKEV